MMTNSSFICPEPVTAAPISDAMIVPRMMAIPPIDGVPALLLCDSGPSSLMFCPICCFFSMGIRMPVIAHVSTADIINVIITV